MKIGLKYKGKKILINAKECRGAAMGRGLMFRFKKNAPALVFSFSSPTTLALTSLFVFFPFLVLWLDDKNKIIAKKRVSPFKFMINQKEKFSRIIEIPINYKYKEIIELLDDD